MLEQTKWLQLSSPFSKKAHAFAEIWIQDPDHNPEHTYALDRSALAPLVPGIRIVLSSFMIVKPSGSQPLLRRPQVLVKLMAYFDK